MLGSAKFDDFCCKAHSQLFGILLAALTLLRACLAGVTSPVGAFAFGPEGGRPEFFAQVSPRKAVSLPGLSEVTELRFSLARAA